MKLLVIIMLYTFNSAFLLAGDIESQISIKSDDAEESLISGEMELDSSDLEMIEEHQKQIVGLRFQNITIPKGAVVTNAYIQFTVDERNSEPTKLTIYGELNPNASTFSYESQDISMRVKTSSYITWQDVPEWLTLHENSEAQQSSDISSIIQEIIDQGGWISGNSLALIISGEGKRVAKSYDKDRLSAPILYVTYEGDDSTDNSSDVNTDSVNIVKNYISSNSDSAEESSGYINTSSSDLELVQDKNKHQIVGLRFVDVDIPKNANITKAYIQFTVDESSSQSTNLAIYGEKSANARTFLKIKNNISSREKTQTSTSWSPEPWDIIKEQGVKQRTDDLSDIIQELIEQNSWNIGNSMAFMILGDGKRVAESYHENKTEEAPFLYVEYSGENDSDDDDNSNNDSDDGNIYVSSAIELKRAITSAVDGATIILEPGVYYLSDNIVISQNNLTIASRYYLTQDESYIDSTTIKGRGISEHRMFDASRDSNAGANLKFIGLTIKDAGKFVTFTKGNDNLVNHCNITKIRRDSVSFDSVAGGKVLYCNIINTGDDSIDVDTRSIGDFEFAYNNLLGSGDDGIEIHLYRHSNDTSPLMYHNIHHNIIKDSRNDAIQLIDYDEKTDREFNISNNQFIDNGTVAIGAIYKETTHKSFAGTNLLEFVKISNNSFIGGKYHILGGDNMQVKHNQFKKASIISIKRVKGDSVISNNSFSQNNQNWEDSNINR